MSNSNLKFLILRNINQDPLENFFGKIRSQGLRNINPTCWNFIHSFKSLLINNLTSIKSLRSNCEDDDSCGILSNFKKFLFYKPDNYEIPTVLPNYSDIQRTSINLTQDMTLKYVAGYLASTLFKKIKKCRICTNELIGNYNTEAYNLINIRNYVPRKTLHHPSTNFSIIVTEILKMITTITPQIIHLPFLSKKLILLIELNINFNFLTCPLHNIKNIMKEKFVNLYLFTLCKNINRILNGKDKNNYTNNNLKQLARQTYIKKCKKKLR